MKSCVLASGVCDKVLLKSGNGIDKCRPAHHQVVIGAATVAGVALLAFTSAPGSLTAAMADEHSATEQALVTYDEPYTRLRNGGRHESYTENLARFPLCQVEGVGAHLSMCGLALLDERGLFWAPDHLIRRPTAMACR